MLALTPPRRFTVDEYYRMAEVGIPEPAERVEVFHKPEGEGYAGASTHARGDVPRPTAFRDLEMPVGAILP